MINYDISALWQQIEIQLQALILEFEQSPLEEAFYNIGAVAEVAITDIDNQQLQGIVKQLVDSTFRWLKTGLLEDILFSKMEYGYHAAIMCVFASKAPQFRADDLKTIETLITQGMLLRSESPVLTQFTVEQHFITAGIKLTSPSLGKRQLGKMINKRLLRSRTDEYDLAILCMLAQVKFNLDGNDVAECGYFAKALLVQAIRNKDHNRIAYLSFMCSKLSKLPHWLLTGATTAFNTSQFDINNFPAPISNQIDSMFIQRAKKGMQLRSAICYALLLQKVRLQNES